MTLLARLKYKVFMNNFCIGFYVHYANENVHKQPVDEPLY